MTDKIKNKQDIMLSGIHKYDGEAEGKRDNASSNFGNQLVIVRAAPQSRRKQKIIK